MMSMEILQNRNRTLIEVNTGALFWGIIATIIGMALPADKLESCGLGRLDWCMAIWAAVVMVFGSMRHMQRCLDRALGFDEGTATKLVFRGYMIRYMAVAVTLIAITVTGALNPVVFCLGYLLIMKVAVYSQPFTHKLYNWLFKETDPIPEPLDEEPQSVRE